MLNQDKPLVSVILPCYNAEKYVEESVRSIMDQTYKNLEIILIDDCSSDKTSCILQSLRKEDQRIKLLRNEKNSGLVASLNKGVANANGKYIARMDADDVSLAHRIEMQVNFMEKHFDVALCGSNYYVIDDKNKKTGKIKYPADDATLKAELLFMCPFGHPTILIRKDILEKCGYYEEGTVPAEDYELWVRIAKDHKVANVDDYLLLYRWHGNNITAVQRKNQVDVLEKVMNKHVASFGYADTFINYHLRFVGGTWNKQSSRKEIAGFKQWEKALMRKNLKLRFTSEKILKKIFNKYYANALLSIIKSNSNTLTVKLHAFTRLLFINPAITIKHVVRKVG